MRQALRTGKLRGSHRIQTAVRAETSNFTVENIGLAKPYFLNPHMPLVPPDNKLHFVRIQILMPITVPPRDI